MSRDVKRLEARVDPAHRDSAALRERIERFMPRANVRTPSELADHAGVSKGAFLMFWRGETRFPRRTTLERLAQVLQVPLESLLGEVAVLPADDVVSLTVMVDGEDLDVFQAVASVQRVSATEVIEGELALRARVREQDPVVQALVGSIRKARQDAQDRDPPRTERNP